MPLSTKAIRAYIQVVAFGAAGVLLSSAHAATQDASQAAIRKTEPVAETMKSVISRTVKKLVAIPDLNHLASQSVLIMDASSGKTLFARNATLITPIASITKLMTAMVVLDRGLEMHEPLTISEEDMDSLKFTRSRLRPGTTLMREE